MSGDLKENVTRRSIWLRLVFMIVLSVAFNVAEIITFAVVVFQFLASLFTGQPNDRLAHFGRNLARYFQQITVYLTFTTEENRSPSHHGPMSHTKKRRWTKTAFSLSTSRGMPGIRPRMMSRAKQIGRMTLRPPTTKKTPTKRKTSLREN